MCFFQAEDGMRYLVRSRGVGDVYKRQGQHRLGLGGGDGSEPHGQQDHLEQAVAGNGWKGWSDDHAVKSRSVP